MNLLPVSIGDLSRSLMLRRANGLARSELGGLTADLAAGTAQDPARHLDGHLSPLATLDGDLARAGSFLTASRLAAARVAPMQAALLRIDELASGLSADLLRAGQARDGGTVPLVARAAEGVLSGLVGALNTRAAGHSLFAGTLIDQPALTDAANILDSARMALGTTAATPADILAGLEAWLDDPAGFRAVAFRGNTDPQVVQVAADETVRIDVTAMDPALRPVFKSVIMAALLTDPAFGGTAGTRADLARQAGLDLVAGAEQRAQLSARLGLAEARIDAAGTRANAEITAYRMARNDMVAIDMPDIAARLQETESRIQMLYALTARLSRLSLADYL